MKRFKNLVIGGIQSKVFNLILFTVFLLTAAYMAVSLVHGNMLTKLVTDSGKRQQAAIGEITGKAMDQIVTRSLERSNRSEARFSDDMFDAVRDRVAFLGDCATQLLAHPERSQPRPVAAPDLSKDGQWTAKAIYAGGVDPDDPAVAAKVALMGNLADTMLSLCTEFGAETMYVALPEGVHISVSRDSAGWFIDGAIRDYDPRGREWYIRAVEAGALIFTDGEWDATTGDYCVECALPVYAPDGSLGAVIGTDLFLDQMQSVLQSARVDGEYTLLVNQEGRAVLPMQAEVFPMNEADRAGDLRQSACTPLARTVDRALKGLNAGAALGSLSDGLYYVTASPIPTTGWVLVSAFNQAVSGQPASALKDTLAQIQNESTALYREKTAKSRNTATALLLVVMVLTLAGALVLGKRIVDPLNTIARRITELSEDSLEFHMEDAYRTGDEVEALAEAFADISHKTVVYMDRVVQVTAEKERIGAELSLATDIQAAMLPHIFPAFPDRSEFDIFASMDPAKEVGGDFYDYFLIDDDHLCMVIADVSGKGVPAALFMMASKIILQSVAMLGHSPAEILARTNEAICNNNEAQMFVTTWLGILELSTGKLLAANAGHEYPALKQPGQPFELFKDRHGFVIGGMEGVRYREYEIDMQPGARLFIYTDGVPEATDAEKVLFGTDRMLEALNSADDLEPEALLRHVRTCVDAFVKDAEQFDDLTMLCMHYKGPVSR